MYAGKPLPPRSWGFWVSVVSVRAGGTVCAERRAGQMLAPIASEALLAVSAKVGDGDTAMTYLH